MRHAVRPRATVLICAAKSSQIPFDADKLGALRYRISAQGLPEHEAKYRTLLSDRLNAARRLHRQPVFQLVPDHPNLAKTYVVELRQRLAKARRSTGVAVREGGSPHRQPGRS